MKYCLLVVFFLAAMLAKAQSGQLKQAVSQLDRALVSGDTAALKQLLHEDLSYGHSNGWIETREDVISDMITDKLVYKKIETEPSAWEESGDWAVMRGSSKVSYLLNGREGGLNLHVLQLWVKGSNGWQLVARQSVSM